MNERIYLKLKRQEVHSHVASENFGGDWFEYRGQDALEHITGSYQIGNSKGTIDLVWQPSTNKFLKVEVRSHSSVLDTLLGYVNRFSGKNPNSQQQIGEPNETSQQPYAVEVLQAICVDYLHIPIETKAQDQLRGRRDLEGITSGEVQEISGRTTRELNGTVTRELPYNERKKLKP